MQTSVYVLLTQNMNLKQLFITIIITVYRNSWSPYTPTKNNSGTENKSGLWKASS